MTRTRALKLFVAAAGFFPVFAQVSITPSGSQPSRQGSSENFTGAVRVDSPFDAQDGTRGSGGRFTFQPGARSAWARPPP
jgi:quercetin dioxygenase-like cupin family protein